MNIYLHVIQVSLWKNSKSSNNTRIIELVYMYIIIENFTVFHYPFIFLDVDLGKTRKQRKLTKVMFLLILVSFFNCFFILAYTIHCILCINSFLFHIFVQCLQAHITFEPFWQMKRKSSYNANTHFIFWSATFKSCIRLHPCYYWW